MNQRVARGNIRRWRVICIGGVRMDASIVMPRGA